MLRSLFASVSGLFVFTLFVSNLFVSILFISTSFISTSFIFTMFIFTWFIFASFISAVALPTQAFAQAAQTAAGQPSILESFLPLIIIFFIFYFLIIRPQSRRMKQHQETLKTLKKGDAVLTSGGILGTIEGMTDKWVTLEISDGVKIKALKSQIAGLAKDANPN